MSIRNKITLLFTLLVTLILLGLNITIYLFSHAEVKESFKKRLRSRALNNTQIFSFFGEGNQSVLSKIDSNAVLLLPRKTVVIYDSLKRPVYLHKGPLALDPQLDSSLVNLISESREKYFTRGEFQGYASGFTTPEGKHLIIVTAFDEEGRVVMGQLRNTLFLSQLLGMLVTLIIGYVFSSQLVRPIRDITREVNTISSHNLSRRLLIGGKDELAELGHTFNDLLNRLQESFNIQRRFISNASHELSTPLTSISSQLQVALQKERNANEYQEVMQSIQEDVEQMRQLTKSLLEIAKAGSHGSLELKELRVDELLLKVIADIKKSNPGYEVELQFASLPEDEKECMVYGNADLLYSAIRNIIENGCKYSPDHRSRVNVNFVNQEISILVQNEGDVIAEEEIEHIFQPFYRGRNHSEVRGFGLGLPLAKRIIGIHKGEIFVSSGLSGTIFRVNMPSILQLQD